MVENHNLYQRFLPHIIRNLFLRGKQLLYPTLKILHIVDISNSQFNFKDTYNVAIHVLHFTQ